MKASPPSHKARIRAVFYEDEPGTYYAVAECSHGSWFLRDERGEPRPFHSAKEAQMAAFDVLADQVAEEGGHLA